MARKFKSFETRDKPKKRGPRKHKKSLNKNEKRQKRTRRYKGQGKGWQTSSSILYVGHESNKGENNEKTKKRQRTHGNT